MKFIFVVLKLIQLAFAITVIVACFTSCDVKRKDNAQTWLSRYRQYDINNPQLLFEQADDMYDLKVNSGISYRIVYACVGTASCTILLILISMACKFCKKTTPCVLTFDLLIYVLSLAVWIPFAFCFLWVLLVSWSENLILDSYTRPVSWILAVGSMTCLICFLILDLFLLILINSRRLQAAGAVTSTKHSPSGAVSRSAADYKYFSSGTNDGRHAHLAVSLNSVDILDPDCENVKVL